MGWSAPRGSCHRRPGRLRGGGEFFTEFTGYESWFFQIDIPVVPESGSLVRIQETASGSTDGTARVENLTTGALETSLDGGRMSVDRVSLEGAFQASNVDARMSGGTAPQGDLVACWCDATPIGPEPERLTARVVIGRREPPACPECR